MSLCNASVFLSVFNAHNLQSPRGDDSEIKVKSMTLLWGPVCRVKKRQGCWTQNMSRNTESNPAFD